MRPLRLTRSRAKGARLVSPDGKPVRYVGRPTIFGNPFHEADFGRVDAVRAFTRWLLGIQWRTFEQERRRELIRRLPELAGCHVACFCKEGEICHGDPLLRLVANPTVMARLRREIER